MVLFRVGRAQRWTLRYEHAAHVPEEARSLASCTDRMVYALSARLAIPQRIELQHGLEARTRRIRCCAVDSLQGIRTEVVDAVEASLGNCLTETNFKLGPQAVGKVRDTYDLGDKLLIVTTDRQSAFDRVLASIPFKGQVLNETAAWWFKATEHIIGNALLSVPDPNATLMTKCTVFPVEFIVRGFMTGSTDTSLWTHYKRGEREYCGHKFPDGMRKNERLTESVLTPTTKAAEGDVPISAGDVVSSGLMSKADWDVASAAVLRLFEFGQAQALERGLLLVDTKYELGRDADGNILVVDEMHTPDSSRYWLADTYEQRHEAGQEPENIDKEFLRLWFRDNCDPYADKDLPEAPAALRIELAKRYIYLYEAITGERFKIPDLSIPVQQRIASNLSSLCA